MYISIDREIVLGRESFRIGEGHKDKRDDNIS